MSDTELYWLGAVIGWIIGGSLAFLAGCLLGKRWLGR